MISAQNHRLRLSGNSLNTAILFLFILLMSCSPKRTTRTTAERPSSAKETVRVYDKETDSYKNVPKNTTIDTVEVKRSDEKPVIDDTSYENQTDNKSDNYRYEEYKIALLLPLFSQSLDTTNFETERKMEYFHYYQGFRLACETWLARGLKAKIDVYDIAKKANKPEYLKSELRDYQLVMGGYEKEDIEFLRQWSQTQSEMLYISPFRNIGAVDESSHFIQLEPSILTQLQYIAEFAAENHDTREVTIVIQEGDENRSAFFQRYLKETFPDSDTQFKELVISDETQHMEETDIEAYFRDMGESVFILPYTSGSFFRTFLRKLKTERGERSVIVYGLHHWLEDSRIDLDYYNNLGLRLCTWHYPQYASGRYEAFIKQFHDYYGVLPTSDMSVKGYDHARYLLEMLYLHGMDVASYNENGELAEIFNYIDLEAVMSSKGDRRNTESVMFYENGALRMVKLENGEFVECSKE